MVNTERNPSGCCGLLQH